MTGERTHGYIYEKLFIHITEKVRARAVQFLGCEYVFQCMVVIFVETVELRGVEDFEQ